MRFVPAAVAVLVLSQFSVAQPNYVVQDLGSLGGDSSRAWDINDRGVVVGEAEDATGRSRPFVFDREMRELPSSGSGLAIAIDNRGVAVGADAAFATGWTGGASFDLAAGPSSLALDVNERGEIVGRKRGMVGPTMSSEIPFVFDRGQIIELGTLGGTRGVANAINDRGIIVGSAEDTAGRRHAFVYEKGEMIDLTPASDRPAGAFDINNRGVVVGEQGVGRGFRAVRWIDGLAHDLGSLGGEASAALAISENGTIVGVSQNASDENRAFVWTESTGLLDLNALAKGTGLVLTEAWGINERGWIVGVGINAAGDERAFLAKPARERGNSTSNSGDEANTVSN